MSDRRDTPRNARVAAAHLTGVPPGIAQVVGRTARVAHPVLDLCRAPGGARDRQLLWGETATVYEDLDGWSFVQSGRDGYVGYVVSGSLGEAREVTHWVSAPATHVYEAADIKSPDRAALSLGSRIKAVSERGAFVETPEGFVPSVHLMPVGSCFADPVAVAALLVGTPYLWGGNSRSGIDCSGLVQAALLACGLDCPGDSDQQLASLGDSLPENTAARRGDLLFWKGHVAWVSDPGTILHANAFHMAVSYEPLKAAIQRIKAQGDGTVTGHIRP